MGFIAAPVVSAQRRSVAAWAAAILILGGVCSSSSFAQTTPGAAQWQLIPEIRIGSLDGGADALTKVTHLAVDASGSVFIAQPMSFEVKTFGRDGRYIGVIGGEGSGPGEFMDISEMGIRGDTLWVYDRRQTRFTEFSLDGGLLQVVTRRGTTLPNVGRPVVPRARLIGGRYLAIALEEQGDFMQGGNGVEHVIETDSMGAPTGEFASARVSGVVARVIVDGKALHLIRPLRSLPHTAWSANGHFVAHVDQALPDGDGPTNYRVTLFRTPQDTVYTSKLTQEAVRVASVAADSIHQSILQLLSRIGITSHAAVTAVMDQVGVPEFWPPVNQIVVSSDGRVFLSRSSMSGEYLGWTVLRTDGKLAGTFRSDGRLEILAVHEDEIWGTVSDEFDIPYVVRYRLEAGARVTRNRTTYETSSSSSITPQTMSR